MTFKKSILEKFDRQFLAGYEDIDSAGFTEWLQQQRIKFSTLIDSLREAALAQVSVQNNLPRLLTPSFGRERETKRLTAYLSNPDLSGTYAAWG